MCDQIHCHIYNLQNIPSKLNLKGPEEILLNQNTGITPDHPCYTQTLTIARGYEFVRKMRKSIHLERSDPNSGNHIVQLLPTRNKSKANMKDDVNKYYKKIMVNSVKTRRIMCKTTISGRQF